MSIEQNTRIAFFSGESSAFSEFQRLTDDLISLDIPFHIQNDTEDDLFHLQNDEILAFAVYHEVKGHHLAYLLKALQLCASQHPKYVVVATRNSYVKTVLSKMFVLPKNVFFVDTFDELYDVCMKLYNSTVCLNRALSSKCC